MKNKKLWLLLSIFVIILTACGSKAGSTSESTKTNEKDFLEVIGVYFEKQQNLMRKQSEGQSGEFAELLEHAKNIVNSTEYQEWSEENEKLEKIKISNSANSEKLIQLQEALKEYGTVQADYFQKLAKTENAEAYNQVNSDFEKKLNDTQDKFIAIFNDIQQ